MKKCLINKKILSVFFLLLSFVGKTNIALSSELNNNNDQEEVQKVNPFTIISKDAFGVILRKLNERDLRSVARVCKGFGAIAGGVITERLQERFQQIPKLFGKGLGGNIQEALGEHPPVFYARALKDLTDDPKFVLNFLKECQEQLMEMKLEPLNFFFLVSHSQKFISRKFGGQRMLPYYRDAIISKLSVVPLAERKSFLIQAKKILTNKPKAFEVICTIEELSEITLADREAFVECVQHFLQKEKFSDVGKANLLVKINNEKLYKKAILMRDLTTEIPINLNDYDNRKKRCVLQ